MTDTVEVITTDKVETVADAPVVELSPVEQAASEQGWVPKEVWVEQGRDASEWRSAKEFNDRGQLYKTIHNTNRELKQTQQQLVALRRHNEYIFQKAYNQAKDELRREKRLAMREQDFDAVEAIENDLEALEANHVKEIQSIRKDVAPENGPPPELQEWMDKNTWYTSDSDLRDFADAVGLVYFNKNPGVSSTAVLKHIETEIKRKFPEKFGVRRAAPNAVATVDRTNRQGPKQSDMVLDELEQEIMTQLVKSGEMTEKEYKDQLRKAKGIK